jgi:hypothetical protein
MWIYVKLTIYKQRTNVEFLCNPDTSVKLEIKIRDGQGQGGWTVLQDSNQEVYCDEDNGDAECGIYLLLKFPRKCKFSLLERIPRCDVASLIVF